MTRNEFIGCELVMVTGTIFKCAFTPKLLITYTTVKTSGKMGHFS